MASLPVEVVPLTAEYDTLIGVELQNKRLSIFSKDKVTLISGLQDYISLLFERDDKEKSFSRNVPWKLDSQYKKWLVRDEISASSVLLVLSYQELANSKILSTFENENLEIEENNWKLINGWLKLSLSLLQFLLKSEIYNNNVKLLSLDFLNYLYHQVDSQIQLNLLMKLNHTKVIKIKQNDWNFKVDTKNHLIYLSVSVYIGDQLSICQQLVQRLPNERQLLDYIKILRLYVKIYIAYYLALDNYANGKIGMSLGILNYIKSHLLKNEDEDEDTNKFKKKMLNKFTKSSQSEKELIKQIASQKDFKLNKKFTKILNSSYNTDLINLVKLIDLMNLKFLKENDNIQFEKVSNADEVAEEFKKLPLGRKIPLSIDEMPKFLRNYDQSKQDYAGSGSYF